MELRPPLELWLLPDEVPPLERLPPELPPLLPPLELYPLLEPELEEELLPPALLPELPPLELRPLEPELPRSEERRVGKECRL